MTSTSLNFNIDHENLLSLTREIGYVDEDLCLSSLGWSKERFRSVSLPLIQEGIAWVDIHQGNFFDSNHATKFLIYYIN